MTFQIEVCEIDVDLVVVRGDNLPDTVLVRRVEVGVGGGGDGAVHLIDVAAARIWRKTQV